MKFDDSHHYWHVLLLRRELTHVYVVRVFNSEDIYRSIYAYFGNIPPAEKLRIPPGQIHGIGKWD
jgi:hypothetical protein